MLTKKISLLLVALLITTFSVVSCLQTVGAPMVEPQQQAVVKENKLDSLKSEMKVVQKKAQKVDQLERQKSALMAQVQNVSQSKDSLESSLYSSDKQLSEKQDAVQRLNVIVKSLKEDKKIASDIADAYFQDIKKLSDSLFTANQRIERYKRKVGILETKLSVARESKQTLQYWAYGLAVLLVLTFLMMGLFLERKKSGSG